MNRNIKKQLWLNEQGGEAAEGKARGGRVYLKAGLLRMLLRVLRAERKTGRGILSCYEWHYVNRQ